MHHQLSYQFVNRLLFKFCILGRASRIKIFGRLPLLYCYFALLKFCNPSIPFRLLYEADISRYVLHACRTNLLSYLSPFLEAFNHFQVRLVLWRRCQTYTESGQHMLLETKSFFQWFDRFLSMPADCQTQLLKTPWQVQIHARFFQQVLASFSWNYMGFIQSGKHISSCHMILSFNGCVIHVPRKVLSDVIVWFRTSEALHCLSSRLDRELKE